MQWCFTCVSAGSLSCVKEDNAIFNMSTNAENLNAKISLSSFQKDIEKWKSVNEDLKAIFPKKPAFSEEIFTLMDNVDSKLDILSAQLSGLSFDHEREQTDDSKYKSISSDKMVFFLSRKHVVWKFLIVF